MAKLRAGSTTGIGDLFEEQAPPVSSEALATDAVLLRGCVAAEAAVLVDEVNQVAAASPFRHMVTRGGFEMSVAMTNCGRLGWTSDRSGYRYTETDPLTGKPWPALPERFLALATKAAAECGFPGFDPDACLINRYGAGTRMGLHQDKDEKDFAQPIVSVSLGLPAVFLFGGVTRKERPRRILLQSGDVVVWGGSARLAYHGVAPLPGGEHPLTGAFRLNLTFRKVL